MLQNDRLQKICYMGGVLYKKLIQNCAKIVFTHEKTSTLWTEVLIFVSGILSVANVEKKNGCKKSAKGEGFYG